MDTLSSASVHTRSDLLLSIKSMIRNHLNEGLYYEEARIVLTMLRAAHNAAAQGLYELPTDVANEVHGFYLDAELGENVALAVHVLNVARYLAQAKAQAVGVPPSIT